jgi:hypothetical protein
MNLKKKKIYLSPPSSPAAQRPTSFSPLQPTLPGPFSFHLFR